MTQPNPTPSEAWLTFLRALRVDRMVDWLGARRRNRVIFVGIYVAMGIACVVTAALGMGSWPHG